MAPNRGVQKKSTTQGMFCYLGYEQSHRLLYPWRKLSALNYTRHMLKLSWFLKKSCDLWNSTLVLSEDLLSCTIVDLIRSDWKLKPSAYIRFGSLRSVKVWYQCGDLGCDDEYIGEISRTFDERYKEHLKAPSAIHHHSIQTGHTTNQNNFQIIGREGQNLARNIKESIYIRVNNPSLNNNIGKFNLSHIWDRVLLNTKDLSLK